MVANKRATMHQVPPQTPTQEQPHRQRTHDVPSHSETNQCEVASSTADPIRCCHCCSSTSGAECPRRTTVQRPTALLGAPVSPLLWGVRHQQPRPIDDRHYMLDKTKPLYLAPDAHTDDSHTLATSSPGGWPTTAIATAAQWRPSFFQCCYSYASGALCQRPPSLSNHNRSSLRPNEDGVARIGARSSSSDDV